MLLVRTRTVLHTLLAGFVCCLTAAPAQAQTTLRYKFKTGDKLTYDVHTESKSKVSIGGNDLTSGLKMNLDVTWRVVEVDKEGKARIAQKMNRIRMTMEEPGQNRQIDYDSKDGQVPEGKIARAMGTFFNAIAGTEITVTMDSHGDIADVELPEKLMEALKKVGEGSKDKSLDEMFSPDGLKNMFTQGGLILPKEVVSKGSTWAKKIDKKMPFGAMKGTKMMTFEGTATVGGRTLEKIGIKAVVTMEPDPNAPVVIKIKSNDSHGTALFDNAAGRLVEMNMSETMQMEISVGGMDLASNVRTTTILRLRPNAP